METLNNGTICKACFKFPAEPESTRCRTCAASGNLTAKQRFKVAMAAFMFDVVGGKLPKARTDYVKLVSSITCLDTKARTELFESFYNELSEEESRAFHAAYRAHGDGR